MAEAKWAEGQQIGARVNSAVAGGDTCALETTGTASKSNLSKVLPTGKRASARWRHFTSEPHVQPDTATGMVQPCWRGRNCPSCIIATPWGHPANVGQQ